MKTTIKLLILLLVFSCAKTNKIKQKTEKLATDAKLISQEFSKIVFKAEELAKFTQLLYLKPNPTAKQSYKITSSGIMYKNVDDGGSAVFASGYVPVNNKVKEVVYLTEDLDSEFKKIKQSNSNIIQVYYNDKHSINRIYPFFDVLIQYEPKMNITSFNFYYLADKNHNPAKKGTWVNTPYLDPAGRGWMLSAIAPVYVNDDLKGVIGIDITVNNIVDEFINPVKNIRMIVDAKGNIVAAKKMALKKLNLPNFNELQYFSTVKADTYQPDTFNILKSKNKNLRKIAKQILIDNQTIINCNVNHKSFNILSQKISGINWFLLEITE